MAKIDSRARDAPHADGLDHCARCAASTICRDRCRASARRLRLCHRRFRFRQEHAGASRCSSRICCAQRNLAGDESAGACDGIDGAELISQVVMVDQSPLSRTPRSSPAVYLGVFDGIREAFAASPDALAQGLTASAFSFNSGTGRCERCSGKRLGEDRDAVPERRLRALPGMRREALPAAHSRDQARRNPSTTCSR